MPKEKVNARDWVVSINTGTVALPVWTQIGGLTSLNITRATEKTATTDFDSDGIAEHQVMERGKSLEIEGHFLEDPADKTRDAGQEAVEALANEVGLASLKQFKFVSPGGTGKIAKFSAEMGGVGGGNNAKTSWSATLERSGAETAAA